jgi:hypothetical protein
MGNDILKHKLLVSAAARGASQADPQLPRMPFTQSEPRVPPLQTNNVKLISSSPLASFTESFLQRAYYNPRSLEHLHTFDCSEVLSR